ncbi:MAG: AbrB/MazE/SpoVT family DNA-binding domain-containing protein [Candidatus Korarchaeota archaeon]|nr:AbrB/MazE/SpoVT family DNA-binding domain-containing protein [Candidatus Korarchaeota archaeon]MDK2384657.1 AbrB/MazE/SpoVT family DNA-binding domain-containing protein [Candidatus Korarchaeota archaeon]
MPRVKVTRNYQVTIPAEVRNELGIREGDYLEVYVSEEGHIVMKKVRRARKTLRSGRKLTIEEIDEVIERGRRETF